jgi:hypothetical protein
MELWYDLSSDSLGWRSTELAIHRAGDPPGWRSTGLAIHRAGDPPGWRSTGLAIQNCISSVITDRAGYSIILRFYIFLAARLISLNWWTRNCSIRAINTTIAFVWFQNCFTILALVKELTGIYWHFFYFFMSAFWTSNF